MFRITVDAISIFVVNHALFYIINIFDFKINLQRKPFSPVALGERFLYNMEYLIGYEVIYDHNDFI